MLKAANITSTSLEPNENQVLLRRIARAGKVWKNTMGRRIDMESASYMIFYLFKLTKLIGLCSIRLPLSARVGSPLGR